MRTWLIRAQTLQNLWHSLYIGTHTFNSLCRLFSGAMIIILVLYLQLSFAKVFIRIMLLVIIICKDNIYLQAIVHMFSLSSTHNYYHLQYVVIICSLLSLLPIIIVYYIISFPFGASKATLNNFHFHRCQTTWFSRTWVTSYLFVRYLHRLLLLNVLNDAFLNKHTY